MKKIMIFVAALLMLTASVSSSYALLRKDFSAVEGPVIAKNVKTMEITVRNSGGSPQTFQADADQWGKVKEGDVVLILHQNDTKSISTLVVTQPK